MYGLVSLTRQFENVKSACVNIGLLPIGLELIKPQEQ